MVQMISKERLITDLERTTQCLSNAPVLIHSDLFKTGITRPPNERLQIGQDYEEALMYTLKSRTILIPTFNYDFCKNGYYNRIHTQSRVGALSDYFRLRYPNDRTLTPVFNFVIRNQNAFSLKPIQNVFGSQSTFAELHRQKGYVFFLGADFNTNTFIHYIEEFLQIGYRYLKSFSGYLIENSSKTFFKIDYRVRPQHSVAIIYDWLKLEKDAIQNGILKQSLVGNGQLLYYQTDELFDFWTKKMTLDPFYLLTPDSKDQVKAFPNYPFTLKMFES